MIVLHGEILCQIAGPILENKLHAQPPQLMRRLLSSCSRTLLATARGHSSAPALAPHMAGGTLGKRGSKVHIETISHTWHVVCFHLILTPYNCKKTKKFVALPPAYL